MFVSSTSLGERVEIGPGIEGFSYCSEHMNYKLDLGIGWFSSSHTERF
uniref:Molybdopterin biosynthesis CNX3 protein n=1 Tax=Arundo donax TaxID=35708 RepID=A0A0A9HB88_ARUDO